MCTEAFSSNPRGRILALGELLVDLVPAREGMLIRDPGPVMKTVSGSAGIFACAAARLGAPSGFIGKVGRDPLSAMAADTIRQEGVDTRCLTVSPEGQIGLAFLEYTPSGRNYQYYREGSAGSRLSAADICEDYVASAFALHFPGMLLELNASMRGACLSAARIAKAHGVLLSFDPNIRREISGDPDAKKRMLEAISLADVVAPTLDEGRQITGRESVGDVLRALKDMGPGTVALTMDRQGAALCSGDRVILADAVRVEEADPTGAGDTFAAALCVGLRENMETDRLAMFCCAAGALAVTRRGAIGMALPSREETDALVSSGACRVREIALSEL